jgi:hypothetical protein
LTAVFVEENLARVSLFACSDKAAAAIADEARSLADPEAALSWDTVMTIARDDTNATVTVRMRYRYEGERAASAQEQWTFGLVDQDGWRVCTIAGP